MRINPAEVRGLAEAIRAVDDAAKKQVPYATSIAINRTLEEVLAGARKQIAERFTVRVPVFVLPPVQLPTRDRATKTRLEGVASLGYSDGAKKDIGARREQILRKFETGGPKTAKDPDFPIAIPTQAIRHTFGDLVPLGFYPQNLRLAPKQFVGGEVLPALKRGKVRTLSGESTSNRKRRKAGMEGIGGTFTINDENGRPIGVFQRIGRGDGRQNVRMIWLYKQRIRIPNKLSFFPLAQQIVDERLLINWEGALALALRTAR